jgi:glyoxylase-like metal-dependent hydrolase (beta-lactamase superfamily II)
VAIVDPGPDVGSPGRALADRVAGAERVSILLTHGHGDHAGAAAKLAARIAAPVCAPAPLSQSGLRIDRTIRDGDTVETDHGTLVAVHTPGHTREHLCFHWVAADALFVGDLVLGEGDTTWVAEYPGCVADYLDSLKRIRALDVSILYPAHGAPLRDAQGALDRFERHRRTRIEQVVEALREAPDAEMDGLLDRVYGDALPDDMRGAARQSLGALVDYVNGVSGVRSSSGDT